MKKNKIGFWRWLLNGIIHRLPRLEEIRELIKMPFFQFFSSFLLFIISGFATAGIISTYGMFEHVLFFLGLMAFGVLTLLHACYRDEMEDC